MPTTSNFGWTTPADTDLVKDGAAAIRTLGSAIDASLVDLKGGNTGQVLSKTTNTDLDFTWSSAISPTIVDAKGDLIAATGSDAVSRLAVGADGTYLTADSSTATGLKWAAISAGGMTEIASTTFNDTASSVTYSSLGSYKHIFMTGQGLSSATTSLLAIWVRFNSDTGNNYSYAAIGNGNGSASVPGGKLTGAIQLPNTLALSTDANERHGFFTLWIPNYASGENKTLTAQTGSFGSNQEHHYSVGGNWDNTAAITSITLTNFSATNFKTGVIKVYGVN